MDWNLAVDRRGILSCSHTRIQVEVDVALVSELELGILEACL